MPGKTETGLAFESATSDLTGGLIAGVEEVVVVGGGAGTFLWVGGGGGGGGAGVALGLGGTRTR